MKVGRHYVDTHYTTAQLLRAKAIAKKAYKAENGEISIKRLERKAKVSQDTIKKWMDEEDWRSLICEEPGDRVNLSQSTRDFLYKRADELGLSEGDRLFCLHYMKTFNQTTAAARAGYSPKTCHTIGSNRMHDPVILDFLSEIKAHRDEELFFDIMDVVRMQAKIAFSDITDVMTFKGNEAKLRSSNNVDGQIIQEISIKDDGFKVKMFDKQRSLERLERFLTYTPEERKLKIEQNRFELAKAKALFDMENTMKGNTSNQEEVKVLKKKMNKRKVIKEGK